MTEDDAGRGRGSGRPGRGRGDGRPGRGRRSGWRALRAVVTAVVLVVLVRWLLRQGDVLALPAVTLVLLAWLGLVATWLATWLLVSLGPPGVAAARRLGLAAWAGLRDQPEGRRATAAAARVGGWLRPLAPVGRWLARRLAVTPTGLGRTLPVLVLVAAVVALVALAAPLGSGSGPVVATDERYADLAAQLRTPGITRTMAALSVVARTQGLMLMTGLLVVGALVARAWRGAALLLATSLSASLTITILKAIVQRPRPPVGELLETSQSWPSGHASGGLALALGLSLLLWAAGVQRWRTIAAVVLPLGLLVGYSRAYLTVHWLSDVAAGWLVATAAVALVLLVDGLVRDRLPDDWSTGPESHWPLQVAAALVVVVAVVRWSGGLGTSYPSPPAPELEPLRDVASLVALVAEDPDSTTLLGRDVQPVSVLVVGDRDTIEDAASAAGWVTTDEPTAPRLLEAYRTGLAGDPVATAPVTPSFVRQRMQDLAIARVERSPEGPTRHRARFWRLPVTLDDGCPAWAATAALEDELGWNWRTLVPTRHTAPAIDVERELLVRVLTASDRLATTAEHQLIEPTLGAGATGDPYFTDGTVVVVRQSEACDGPTG